MLRRNHLSVKSTSKSETVVTPFVVPLLDNDKTYLPLALVYGRIGQVHIVQHSPRHDIHHDHRRKRERVDIATTKGSVHLDNLRHET